MDEIRLIVLRFVFSILTFLVVSYLSSSGGISDLTSDLLATPEEKEQRRDAQLVLDPARRLFPQLDQQEGLSSHETIAAAALILPRSCRPTSRGWSTWAGMRTSRGSCCCTSSCR